MTRFYEPDLTANPDSPFVRDASNTLVRRRKWQQASDRVGQKLAYVYFEEEPGRRSAAKLLTRDEARRISGEHREAARAINTITP
jgi:hypothetical protein